MCCLGNFGCFVVADMGVQSGNKHKGFVNNLVNLVTVGLDAYNAVEIERLAAVS